MFPHPSLLTVSSAAAAPATDPYFSNVVLLMGADGMNGSTTFTDESSYARTLTAAGNAQITTANKVFGTGAATFDGAGDLIKTNDAAELQITGSFTAEGWFRFVTKTGPASLMGQWDDAGSTLNNCWFLYMSATNNLRFRMVDGASNNDFNVSFTPTLGTWYYIAAVRDGISARHIHIGTAGGSTSVTSVGGVANPNNSTGKLTIGAIGTTNTFPTLDFNGQADEVRLTIGVARYGASSFAVPSAAFPRS